MKSDAEFRVALMQSLRTMLGRRQWPILVEVDHGVVTASAEVDTTPHPLSN